MSILSAYTGYSDFTTIDDATGCEVTYVVWVDDAGLEYAFVDLSGSEPETKIKKVTRVTVNYVTREIHLNEPALISIQIGTLVAAREQGACDECCDESACRRCCQCLRFKAPFGEVNAP